MPPPRSEAIVPYPPTSRLVSAVSSSARGGIRFKTVKRVDRVPGVEFGEAGQVVDRVHQVEVLRAMSMQPPQGRRLRHLTMSSQVRSSYSISLLQYYLIQSPHSRMYLFILLPDWV